MQELEKGMQPLIGGRLAELRSENRLTQEELAEQLGVSRQAISKWESDKTFPNIDKLLSISALYQVSLDYLLKGEEYDTRVKDNQNNDLEKIEEDKQENSQSNEQLQMTDIENNQEHIVNDIVNDIENDIADDITSEIRNDMVKTSGKDKQKGKPVVASLYVVQAIIILTVLLLMNCIMLGKLLINKNWNANNEESMVYVDTIYEQYTKAKVVEIEEDGSYVEKTVWLDKNGVREYDWINTHYNEKLSNGIRIDYDIRTIILPILSAVVLLILILLLGLEMRKINEAKEE